MQSIPKKAKEEKIGRKNRKRYISALPLSYRPMHPQGTGWI